MTKRTKTDALLLQYAAGALGSSESFLVAVQLSLNPEACRKVMVFEAMGGQLMQEETPVTLSSQCLDSVLKKITGATSTEMPPARSMAFPVEIDLPLHLHQMFSDYCASDPPCWSYVCRGVRKMDVQICSVSAKRLRLIYLEPHQAAPAHTHLGAEITLVLSGNYSDSMGVHGPGDIAIVDDPAFVHSPTAGPEGCLCLTLTESTLRFEDRFNRFLNLFIRL